MICFVPILVPTLESRCTPRKDNSTVSDSPKDSGNGRDDQHNNSTVSDPPKDSGNGRDDQHNNSTVADPPKDSGNGRDDQHNDDNDDKVNHQDANAGKNCDNHNNGVDQDQQPMKKKSQRDKVLHILSVAMMIVGIITTTMLVALGLLWGFIKMWACLRKSCERGEESMPV